jgi:16S rRNA (uracil1498-N3)-methyltransferase
MRIPRIYSTAPLAGGQTQALDEDAGNHVARVLRLREGDALRLFNGDGWDYPASIQSVTKKLVQVTVAAPQPAAAESPLRIHLGQVMSRGDRMDYAVQKATELGVSQITPLHSARCEVKLSGERQEKREQHWQQVVISACEQSGRATVPQIEAILPLADWLGSVTADLKLVLHHHSAMALETQSPPASVAVLVGPEGGLTEQEVTQAKAAGFVPVAFGNRVFRTESAAVVALSVLQWLWGDFK